MLVVPEHDDGVSPCGAKVIPVVDYSIIIPVFNREDLTRQCLTSLPATLPADRSGEVIVVDNGSGPATAAVLADFPWVRTIRNEENRGFAAACNQGARAAGGRILIHLNNDTLAPEPWIEPLLDDLADPAVGIAAAKLLFPNGTIQHAGVALTSLRFGPEGVAPFHLLWQAPGTHRGAQNKLDFTAVTGACLATPRALFLELGGFDETYWNGYEDIDYCFKVSERGLRIVYDPASWLYHYESQSGVQRKRRLMHNVRELGARWGDRILADHNRWSGLTGTLRREAPIRGLLTYTEVALPPVTVLVHGPAPADAPAFVARLRGGTVVPAAIHWAAAGDVPAQTVAAADWFERARALTEVRADRYVAFVDTRSELEPEWLADLVDAVEYGADVAAGAAGPAGAAHAVNAQATLVSLSRFAQDLRIDTAAGPDAALAAWTEAAVARGRALRLTPRAGRVREQIAPDPQRIEALSAPLSRAGWFTSIVMLSWNAPEYTEIAVRSIRAHTEPGTYEIIIVDNGSGPDTLARLAALEDVRIIYNPTNLGFARGCNQGIAAARGSHVLLLNNDVFVTPEWLDRLLGALQRDPAAGVSAPRSNNVAGDQMLVATGYTNETEMIAFALARSRDWDRRTYHTDRAIGFCLCIDRRVIDEIGGIDERYGVGNFEDDDFCVRVRAAGYEIVVCEDVMIHHFGSVSFKANNVDYTAQMERNWKLFAERWDLPRAYPTNGYSARAAIARGFDRRQHYIALPGEPAAAASAADAAFEPKAIALVAIVEREADWNAVGAFANNYLRALRADDDTVLAIAVRGDLDALTIGARLRKTLAKLAIEDAAAADVLVEDRDDLAAWLPTLGRRVLAVRAHPDLAGLGEVPERSPSAIARLARSAG